MTATRAISGTSAPSRVARGATRGRARRDVDRGRARIATRARDARGGANFERLIRRSERSFPRPERDDELEALDAFWRRRGASEHQRARLVAMGRDLASGAAARELYGSADALGRALERLEAMLPRGVDAAKMLWQCPEVLQLPLREVARRLIALKRAFPRANAERVLEGNPRALLVDDLRVVADAVDELQREFPQVDMMAVIDFEPHVIQRALPARVRALKSIKPGDRSASLRAFYPSRVDDPSSSAPIRSAQLFAKVFLLTTECSFPRGDV